MIKKRRFFENKEIAKERINILEMLIKEQLNSQYNRRYKDLIIRIKKKYKLFGGRRK